MKKGLLLKLLIVPTEKLVNVLIADLNEGDRQRIARKSKRLFLEIIEAGGRGMAEGLKE